MRPRWALVPVALLIAACATADRPGPSNAAIDPMAVRRGAYLFTAANCQGCHTDTRHHGPFLAGGVAIASSYGTFYTRNITPDPVDGIGRWSDADFLRALRQGVSPSGAYYYPAFPFTSFTRMTDRDILDIKAYLMTQTPVPQPDRPHALHFPWSIRALVLPWRWLYFHPGPLVPDPAHDAQWNRGAYLVQAVAHCEECHTPRNALGGRIESRAFAGYSMTGQAGPPAPNITQDRESGIGRWSRQETVSFLATGFTPEGDAVGGRMAEVIDRMAMLTPADRDAIAAYLKTIAPVAGSPRRAGKT